MPLDFNSLTRCALNNAARGLLKPHLPAVHLIQTTLIAVNQHLSAHILGDLSLVGCNNLEISISTTITAAEFSQTCHAFVYKYTPKEPEKWILLKIRKQKRMGDPEWSEACHFCQPLVVCGL